MHVYPSTNLERQESAPIRPNETVRRTVRPSKSRSTFRTVLILAILIAIIFGILLVVYIIRQRSTYQTVLLQVDEEEKRNHDEKALFDTCIDQLWENLLRLNFNQSNPEHRQPIRIRVFNTLRHLTGTYKRDLIIFLYEHGLIRADIPMEQRLDLHDADLNDVHFENVNLDYLYLPGVTATNSRFSNCTLKKANFQGTRMDGSHFTACSLGYSIFSDASLKRSSFNHQNILLNIDFTNADLFGSDIDVDVLDSTCITLNARCPNGSFCSVDSGNLVIDGGAERFCDAGRSSSWWAAPEYPPLTVARIRNNSCVAMQSIPDKNNCYFQGNVTSRLVQKIALHQYSTLIDNNRAGYYISAYSNCSDPHEIAQSIVEVYFANRWNFYESDGMTYGMSWNSSVIPMGTRAVRILIGVNIQNLSGNSSSCCAIDDVSFKIFEKD